MCEAFPPQGLLTEKCPWESFVYPVQKHLPHTHTQTTHTSIPLSLSVVCPFSPFTPISLARNTAPYFSWQNSAGRPCVPEKPANMHISHIFCLLCAHTSLRASSHHPGFPAPGTNSSPHLHYIHIPHFLRRQSRRVIRSHSTQNPSLWWFLALFSSAGAGQPCTGVRAFARLHFDERRRGRKPSAVPQARVRLRAHRCLSQPGNQV